MTPLTDAELEKIRHYLGYPLDQRFIDQLKIRATQIEAQYPESLVTLRRQIHEIDRCLQQINSTRPFSAETFSSSGAGTRQYRPDLRLQVHRDEASALATSVGALMNMPVYQSMFAPRWGSAPVRRG